MHVCVFFDCFDMWSACIVLYIYMFYMYFIQRDLEKVSLLSVALPCLNRGLMMMRVFICLTVHRIKVYFFPVLHAAVIR